MSIFTKRSALDFQDLSALRDSIEAKKSEARAILDKLLLDEFKGLGISFHQATWDAENGEEGASEGRTLTIADIRALAPLHWAYEFDEIIVNRGGFDAIITNPPWEVFQTNDKEFLRIYAPSVQKKALRIEDWEKQKAALLEDRAIRAEWLDYCSRFTHQWAYFKKSDTFANQTTVINGKAVGNKPNLYSLFTEQVTHLLNGTGRCGIVIPSGIYTDLGSMQLRIMLFEECRITGLFGFENRKAVFDGVHRSFKFVVLSFQRGGPTTKFPAAFMRLDVSDLTTFPSTDSLQLDVALIKKLSPGSFSIMEFKEQVDVEIAGKMVKFPTLYGAPSGWKCELYGEELNMTRSSKFFLNKPTKYPLFEGGMIWQFIHDYAEPRYWLNEGSIRAEFQSKRLKRIEGVVKKPKELKNDYEATRLAIRKIASNTNERTLIGALLPPHSLTGNSLSVHFPFHHQAPTCNELRFSTGELLCLLALLDGFVTDYGLRSRMTTNLNLFFLYQLPVPRINQSDPAFRPLVERTARLVGTTSEFDVLLSEVFGSKATHKTHGVTDEAQRLVLRAEIDAIVAQLYDLTEDEFAHVLSTFPLVPTEVKKVTLDTFRALLPSPDDAAVGRLISGKESDKVEFKESAAYSHQSGKKQPELMNKIAREIAAFMNTGGGSVILGVADGGGITGIADDIQHADSKKRNHDGYELFLRSSIVGRLGAIAASACKITFHRVQNHEVCRILAPSAPAPVHLDSQLTIRAGTSSRVLSAQEETVYISQHSPAP